MLRRNYRFGSVNRNNKEAQSVKTSASFILFLLFFIINKAKDILRDSSYLIKIKKGKSSMVCSQDYIIVKLFWKNQLILPFTFL